MTRAYNLNGTCTRTKAPAQIERSVNLQIFGLVNYALPEPGSENMHDRPGRLFLSVCLSWTGAI